jgi:cytidylate kinase
MKTIQSLSALKGYISTQNSDSTKLHSSHRYPAITITRQCGSRAHSIVDKLYESLKTQNTEDSPPWIVFENELILRVLRENNLPETLAKFFPEDSEHAVGETVEEIVGLHPSAFTINQKCNALIRTLCRIGHCVIIGRAGNFAAKGMPNTINVRLVGSVSKRLNHIQSHLHLNDKDATMYLEDNDKLRKGYAKDSFNINDLDNPNHYDLVINTDYISDEAAVQAIESLMRAKAAHPQVEYA